MDIVTQIKKHEGLRLKPYRCPEGKLTIGYGRNIQDNGISKEEAEVLLRNDVEASMNEVLTYFPWAAQLDYPRLSVLVNMCFNMGIHRLLGFRGMLEACEEGDYERASMEMLWRDPSRRKTEANKTPYYSSVHGRAEELAYQMRMNEWYKPK